MPPMSSREGVKLVSRSLCQKSLRNMVPLAMRKKCREVRCGERCEVKTTPTMVKHMRETNCFGGWQLVLPRTSLLSSRTTLSHIRIACAMDHDVMSCALFIDTAECRRFKTPSLPRSWAGGRKVKKADALARLGSLTQIGHANAVVTSIPPSVRWCVPLLLPHFVFHPTLVPTHHTCPCFMKNTFPSALSLAFTT